MTDSHPLMQRMHKPDSKLPMGARDKRSVVSIEPGDVDQWLYGTLEEARHLIKLAPLEVFDAVPIEGQPQQSSLL